MTARVLVVDDVILNVKFLQAKLTGEYFDVLTATSGPEALEIIHRELPDIVLLDVLMPDMDGFEVCRAIKEDPKTMHIPVVMVTALNQPSDRVAGLEAGADDFLTKPVHDVALFARVRSLARLKVMMDELRNREATGAFFGGSSEEQDNFDFEAKQSQVLIVHDNEASAERIIGHIGETVSAECRIAGEDAAEQAQAGDFDLIIVSLAMAEVDGLRICSRLRSYEETRNVPILVIVDEGGGPELLRALEMGVNDYLVRPIDRLELQARVRTQLKRKHYADQLRESFHLSMQLATTDAVTGAFNRHYISSHLDTLIGAARMKKTPLSLAMLDIDHFKKVNDVYGHATGDRVLHDFAQRIARNIRGVDVLGRYGGEEFVVIMPETAVETAVTIAERIREETEREPFTSASDDGKTLSITVSIGVAELDVEQESGADLFRRADGALYEAKHAGRNRVLTADPAPRIEAVSA
ncbi:MAG: PleD family two-component system response regulator [Sphingomonadales bacterium]|nr:PleD family two-component system response regulator [Sphingomonadales bacterium]